MKQELKNYIENVKIITAKELLEKEGFLGIKIIPFEIKDDWNFQPIISNKNKTKQVPGTIRISINEA